MATVMFVVVGKADVEMVRTEVAGLAPRLLIATCLSEG